MPAGRPLKFDSVKDLQKRIDSYFAECDSHPVKVLRYEWHTKKKTKTDNKGDKYEIEVEDKSKPPKEIEEWAMSDQLHYTITGLADSLDTSRLTLIHYEEKPEFFNTIKGAKDKIEKYWEALLLERNVAGVIFNLKNNYEWKDKQEVDQHNTGDMQIEVVKYAEDKSTS